MAHGTSLDLDVVMELTNLGLLAFLGFFSVGVFAWKQGRQNGNDGFESIAFAECLIDEVQAMVQF